MEILNVITVPAPDLDNPAQLHIAYAVYGETAGALRASAGLTLKDAIEFYSRDNNIVRETVRVHRPFEQQESYLRRHGVYY